MVSPSAQGLRSPAFNRICTRLRTETTFRGGFRMTKADIVDRIATATGITKTDVAIVVDEFISSVIEAMKRNERVELRGFGVFQVVKRAPRTARNPRTGRTIRIPERYLPVFKPSKILRAMVEEGS